MNTLFLSPSTQDGNPYVTEGNEEYWMNRIADAMEPYLQASGIAYTRNDPDKTVGNSINQSNAGNYDLHLAIHSNAAGSENAGKVRGTDAYYYPTSVRGKRFADILVKNYKRIYPLPDRVRAVPTTTLVEVARTKAPTVLIELAFHDNVEDAEWITSHVNEIARNLSMSVAEYFGVPFIDAVPSREGTVVTMGGVLNLRQKPSTDAAILTQMPSGATVTVLGRTGDWYTVRYGDFVGYAAAQYIRS